MADSPATGLPLKQETVTRKEEEREKETNIDHVYEKPDIIIDSEDKEKYIYEQVEDKKKDVTVKETVKYVSVKEEEESLTEEGAIGYKVKKKKIVEVHKSKKEKKKKNLFKKGLTSIKDNIKGFLKSGTLNKLQVGLQAVTLLAFVSLTGLSGKILQQTSQEPVASDMNTSSSVMEFAQEVNAAIEQALGNGNVTNKALAELANQVIAANMELNEQTNDIINATQRTGDNMDRVEGLVLEQVEVSRNKSLVLNELIKSTVDAMNRLNNITATLSNISNNSASSTQVISDLLMVVNELAKIQNMTDQLVKEPMSCKEIKLRLPNSITGYYFINNQTIYCNMEELCSSGGGWTRLGYLDMTDATQNCPSGFRLYPTDDIRACGRPATNSGSCASVQFPSNGISYSQICGRVTGYQVGHPDASHIPTAQDRNDINSPYVDGVSITRGSPRKHVWTLMAGQSEKRNTNTNCPCNFGSNVNVQSIVGSHYYCESGNPTEQIADQVLYPMDPLWDGNDCHSLEASCCDGLPWFHRIFNALTTDYIELRACDNAATTIEDAIVSLYEIYVQ
uniref:Fibrinogen C-terminal domain-containing protein n=1 Tax=Amphimedon queenslandica TaxID=400682 RepID=A0A1X7UD52_AMPQE